MTTLTVIGVNKVHAHLARLPNRAAGAAHHAIKPPSTHENAIHQIRCSETDAGYQRDGELSCCSRFALSIEHDPTLKNLQSDHALDPETNDPETQMRHALGLEQGAASAPTDDTLRIARQAIRTHFTAREYVERRLGQVEAEVVELQGRVKAARRQQQAALALARQALATKQDAEATQKAAEAALRTERTKREQGDRLQADQRITIQDLRTKLEKAGETIRTLRAELITEREVRRQADQVVAAPMPQFTPVSADSPSAAPSAKRRGRPPKQMLPPIDPVDNPLPATQRASKDPTSKRRFRENQEPVQWWLKER